MGDLKRIDTTSELSGYPSNFKTGYIGFDTWEELQEFVKKNPEFVPIKLTRREGQEIWARLGQTNEPFNNSSEDYGDDYSEFDNTITELEFIENEARPYLGEFDDLGNP